MRKAIALLTTLFFTIAITVSIGLGFKYIKEAKDSVSDEQFMLQSYAIFDDVINILKNSKQLKDINDASSLKTFLSESSFIPLEYKGISVIIEINSARAKLNPNIFKDTKRLEMLKQHLISKMILTQYADILLDSISGIKEDNSYRTDMFENNPTLFRNYITSTKHLEKLNEIYKNRYHDNNIKKLHIDKLFYPLKEIDTPIDLNYATADVFELILGCNDTRAKELSDGYYEKIEDLNLNTNEKNNLAKFKYSFFEPYLDIKIKITQYKKVIDLNYISFKI